MKKTTLLLLLLFSTLTSFAQVLNQDAAWPNTNWSVTGSYDATYFDSDPTVDANFSFDDDDAGGGSNNDIAAESPIIDLTAAFNAGETWILINADYVYRHFSSDNVFIQYWDADASAWVNINTLNLTTAAAPFDDYCAGTPETYNSDVLNIAGFTATQLSGFRYRIYFDDNDIWGYGFCFSSPTIQSQTPPACPDVDAITIDNTTEDSVTVSWVSTGSETSWEVYVQPAGTGEPTTNGTVTSTNPYTETGLSPSTSYEVYVRADCTAASDGYSNWIGPINFTTDNTPPPAPVGVACTTGSSSFIFTEDFDQEPPAGWTGDFSVANGDWDITNGGANSTGTGPSASYSGNTHMEYEASGVTATTASAITPAIDLTTAVDGAELSFYMHAYGADMGTLQVNIGTSATGPFSNIYTWIGEYQTSDTDPWAPIGINLDAYLGQVIYLEFSYTGTTSGFEGDMAIDYVRVEACGDFCIAPNGITASNIDYNSADISWTPSGSETNWYYVVQPAGTGTPTGTGTATTSTSVSETGLAPDTDYEVYVMADCGTNNSVWAGPYNFTTPVQTNFTVDCAVGPTNIIYCYEDSDTNVFTFTSSNGLPLNLNFNAGQVENGWDELIVYDSDGTTNLNADFPYGLNGNGDVSGLSYQSTGSSISVWVQSDGIFNCGDQGYVSLDYTVSCATCINPQADYTIIADCANGDQFLVDVNLTSMGDATSININDDQGSTTQTATATGTFTFGPYANGTPVVFSIANADDASCTITSSAQTQLFCPPANDECFAAEVVTVNDGNCDVITSGTIGGATPSGEANTCFGTDDDDVWYEFVATSESISITFSNVQGSTTDLYHVLYEGTDCTNLTQLYCSDPNESLATGLTIGNTYKIRVYTWSATPEQTSTFDLCLTTVPPPIYTSVEDYTPEELVTDVLIDSECAQVFNITYSTGLDFGSTTYNPDTFNYDPTNGIGYFDQNGSSFPLEYGVVLTSGHVPKAVGPEDQILSDGGTLWPGDADLENNVPTMDPGESRNASILEFDFIPLIDQMSFDFLFASEEYGGFQCSFTDAFAFILTDANGTSQNIAVVPGTTDVISVFTVRDAQYNPTGTCGSVNEEYFGNFYGPNGLPAISAPIDFRGHTIPMTAAATVVPGDTYHIKLVIADAGDTNYDSAIFLAGGSFNIGDIDLGDDILLDSGLANCEGDEVILNAGDVPSNATITWYADGEVISGETSSTLSVTETADYTAEVVYNNTTCAFTDTVTIEFFPVPVPSFTEPSVIKCANEEHVLEVTLDNASDFTSEDDIQYTWYLNGSEIQQGPSNTYTLSETAEEEGTFTVEVTNLSTTTASPCAGTAEIEVEFYENKYCVIPQGISPNGDEFNQCMNLDFLADRDGVSSIKIYNRYGTLIYEFGDYVNEWCGTDQDGSLVPVGTYYYIITFNNGREPITDWIYVNY